MFYELVTQDTSQIETATNVRLIAFIEYAAISGLTVRR